MTLPEIDASLADLAPLAVYDHSGRYALVGRDGDTVVAWVSITLARAVAEGLAAAVNEALAVEPRGEGALDVAKGHAADGGDGSALAQSRDFAQEVQR